MEFPVKQDDILRFDGIYHTFLRQNINSESSYPKELKNLSTIDISVVNIVASKPDVIIREIAEYLKIPNSTLTSSINRLETKGIAKRVISARDRRSFSLELTEKGRKVQQIHIEFERVYFESILSRLQTDGERKSLLDLLEKIVNANPANENSVKKV